MEGGPECNIKTAFSKGGLSSLMSSSSFVNGGDTKGSLLGDSKGGFVNPFESGVFGSDFGAFTRDNAEDDLPDIQARSVKSASVERQADYVGKGTKTSEQE